MLRRYDPVISSPKNFFLLLQQITFSILIWNSKKWGSSTFFAHFIDMRRRIRVVRGPYLLNLSLNIPFLVKSVNFSLIGNFIEENVLIWPICVKFGLRVLVLVTCRFRIFTIFKRGLRISSCLHFSAVCIYVIIIFDSYSQIFHGYFSVCITRILALFNVQFL